MRWQTWAAVIVLVFGLSAVVLRPHQPDIDEDGGFVRYQHECGLKSPRDGPVVVLAGFREWFEELRHTVGSIHAHAPDVPILVVDVGLWQPQRREVTRWHNVVLDNFQYELYPRHVRSVNIFAWRPLLIHQALEKHERMVYITSGEDWRAYKHVYEQIASDTRELVVAGGSTHLRPTACTGLALTSCTHPYAFTKADLLLSKLQDAHVCAIGAMGIRRGSGAVRDVLQPLTDCMLEHTCVDPRILSDHTTMQHCHDLSVVSALLHTNNIPCQAPLVSESIGGAKEGERKATESLASRILYRCTDDDSAPSTPTPTPMVTTNANPVPSDAEVPHSPPKRRKRPASRLTIVTAANERFFEPLKNFVGSVHFWEPEVQVVIWDLGCNEAQVREMLGWARVTVMAFPFDSLPEHLRNLKNYAWKPVAMRYSVERWGNILYQDSGQELRRPVDELRQLLDSEGHFFVAQEGKETNMKCCGKMKDLTAPGMFAELGADAKEFEGALMCAGGIQGYAKDSQAFWDVLVPTTRCALTEACISPADASLDNHRYDQSAFSFFISRAGIRCRKHPRYWANRGNHPEGITRDPTMRNDVLLYTRRLEPGGQYAQFLDTQPRLGEVQHATDISMSAWSTQKGRQ